MVPKRVRAAARLSHPPRAGFPQPVRACRVDSILHDMLYFFAARAITPSRMGPFARDFL